MLCCGEEPVALEQDESKAELKRLQIQSLDFAELKQLCPRYPGIINDQRIDEKTRLWLAAEIGIQKPIEEAIAKGKITSTEKNPENLTLLHVACSRGHLKLATYLVGLIDVNTPNDYGESPLFLAAGSGYVEIVAKLIECSADVNAANIYGETPLYAAAFNGRIETVRILVDVPDCNIHTRTTDGISAFSIAKMKGHTIILDILTEAGKNRPLEKTVSKNKLDSPRKPKEKAKEKDKENQKEKEPVSIDSNSKSLDSDNKGY